MVKKIPINLQDQFRKIKDECSVNSTTYEKLTDKFGTRNHIKGYVEIYENDINDNKRLVDKQNLIVYVGREVLAQMAVHKERISGSNEHSLFISWLSVGNGGATAADPLTPLSPDLTDTGLGGDGSTELVIDSGNTDYIDSGKKKPFDSLEFLQDDANDNRYLIIKITTTLLREECNTNNVNEAALWLCNSDSSSSADASLLRIFSRVCFSTIQKNDTRELVFVWYLFF